MEALEQLTLFTEASLNLAKTSASQASKGDCPASAPASGSRCSELLVSLDPLTSLLRTCVERAISPSIPCTPTWSTKVTKSTLTSYQHLRLVGPTKEKDCSLSESGKMWPNNMEQLWRSPDANCDRGDVSAEEWKERQEKGLPVTLNF